VTVQAATNIGNSLCPNSNNRAFCI